MLQWWKRFMVSSFKYKFWKSFIKRFICPEFDKVRAKNMLSEDMLQFRKSFSINVDFITGLFRLRITFNYTSFYDPQILPGCDCCEDNGKLMADGHTWISNGKTYGKTIWFYENQTLLSEGLVLLLLTLGWEWYLNV